MCEHTKDGTTWKRNVFEIVLEIYTGNALFFRSKMSEEYGELLPEIC